MVDRRTVLGGIGTGTALLVGSVGTAAADDDTGRQGDGTTAEVRVGHLSPDAPAVDIYVGKEPDGDPTIGGLSYPTFAPGSGGEYVDLAAGTYDIAVTPAGATSPQVIDADGLPLEANQDYTVLAVGELSPEGDEPGIQPLPLVDNADEDTTLPPADAALARFVHASPDAGAVDIAVDGTVVLEGVEFGDASPYLEVPPGERTVEVLKGGTTVLKTAPTLEAGVKVSAYVVGNAVPEEGDAELDAVTTIDATSPARGRGREEDEEDEEDEEAGESARGRGRGRAVGRGDD